MLPLIVRPALLELAGAEPGVAGVPTTWVRPSVLRPGPRRRHLRPARRLPHRPPRPPPRAHLEHPALRLLGLRRRLLAPRSRCCWSSAARRSSASASSSSPPSPGWPSCSPTREQREKVLGYTQAFSSIGGLLVGGVNGLLRRPCVAVTAGDRCRFGFLAVIAGIRPRRLALHADVRPDPGHPADPHPAVPAGIAGLASEEGGRHAASGRASPSCSRRQLRRTTIVTTLMFACSYGAAFGAIQQMPQIVPGLPEVSGDGRQAAAAAGTASTAAGESRASVHQGPGDRRPGRPLRAGVAGGRDRQPAQAAAPVPGARPDR